MLSFALYTIALLFYGTSAHVDEHLLDGVEQWILFTLRIPAKLHRNKPKVVDVAEQPQHHKQVLPPLRDDVVIYGYSDAKLRAEQVACGEMLQHQKCLQGAISPANLLKHIDTHNCDYVLWSQMSTARYADADERQHWQSTLAQIYSMTDYDNIFQLKRMLPKLGGHKEVNKFAFYDLMDDPKTRMENKIRKDQSERDTLETFKKAVKAKTIVWPDFEGELKNIYKIDNTGKGKAMDMAVQELEDTIEKLKEAGKYLKFIVLYQALLEELLRDDPKKGEKLKMKTKPKCPTAADGRKQYLIYWLQAMLMKLKKKDYEPAKKAFLKFADEKHTLTGKEKDNPVCNAKRQIAKYTEYWDTLLEKMEQPGGMHELDPELDILGKNAKGNH